MNDKQSINLILDSLRTKPASNKELVQRLGLCRQTVNLYVNALRKMNAIHVHIYRKVHARQEAIYTAEPGVDAVFQQKQSVTILIEDQADLPSPSIGVWHDAIFKPVSGVAKC